MNLMAIKKSSLKFRLTHFTILHFGIPVGLACEKAAQLAFFGQRFASPPLQGNPTATARFAIDSPAHQLRIHRLYMFNHRFIRHVHHHPDWIMKTPLKTKSPNVTVFVSVHQDAEWACCPGPLSTVLKRCQLKCPTDSVWKMIYTKRFLSKVNSLLWRCWSFLDKNKFRNSLCLHHIYKFTEKNPMDSWHPMGETLVLCPWPSSVWDSKQTHKDGHCVFPVWILDALSLGKVVAFPRGEGHEFLLRP